MVNGLVEPQHQITVPGGDATIECNSATPVHWLRKGESLRTFTVFTTLILRNITKQDGGKYECHGHLDSKGRSPFTATAMVLVAGILSAQSY